MKVSPAGIAFDESAPSFWRWEVASRPTPQRQNEGGPVDVPLVAFVHGSMDRMAGFAKLARRLHDRYRVLRYDRRGYAHSRQAGGPYTVAQHVDDLVALLAGRPAVVVGHSFGADVALAAAQRHRALVRGVVVFEAPMPWQPWWPPSTAGGRVADAPSPADAAEKFMRTMIGDARWERLPLATREQRRAEGVALSGELADLHAHAPWDVDKIAVPVICARGEHGAEHHRRAMGWLAGELSCPLEVIAGAGHGAHASHPDALAVLVDRVVALAGLA